MTTKQYRTAMGKTVDIGALMLQNENVRAVGNMGVNARGDTLNSNNKVIDKKNRQIQRQNKKQHGVIGRDAGLSSTIKKSVESSHPVDPGDAFADLPEDNDVVAVQTAEPQGGLAAAIAKARTVQQTQMTPPNTKTGVRKI